MDYKEAVMFFFFCNLLKIALSSNHNKQKKKE